MATELIELAKAFSMGDVTLTPSSSRLQSTVFPGLYQQVKQSKEFNLVYNDGLQQAAPVPTQMSPL